MSLYDLGSPSGDRTHPNSPDYDSRASDAIADVINSGQVALAMPDAIAEALGNMTGEQAMDLFHHITGRAPIPGCRERMAELYRHIEPALVVAALDYLRP